MKKHADKNIAICVLILAILTEWLHTFFNGKVHSFYFRNGVKTPIYWSDMIYYITNESFSLLIVTVILIKIKGKAAKSIMAGVFVWFLIEWAEIFLQLAKINDSRIFINDGSWLQLSTCITISLLVLFGNKKSI